MRCEAQNGGHVVSVNLSPVHGFSKQPQLSIRLLAGRGVEGDAHCGETVQHVYLKRRNPLAANRMQVHLLQAELFDQLARDGVSLTSGDLGENVTTRGIDLLSLPLGTRVHLGEEAVVELTGLRTPCKQIERFQPGLLNLVRQRQPSGAAARAGVMAVVVHGGDVAPGAAVRIVPPEGPHLPLHFL